VAGVNQESAGSQYLAEAIEQIRKNGVRAVFPERNVNSRAVESITKTTGAAVGKALISDAADSAATTYEAFIRHNISAVVAGLADS
jgi:zinc/manganese transport system substrate-binding protein